MDKRRESRMSISVKKGEKEVAEQEKDQRKSRISPKPRDSVASMKPRDSVAGMKPRDSVAGMKPRDSVSTLKQRPSVSAKVSCSFSSALVANFI